MNSFTLIFLLAFAIVTATQFWLAKRQAAYVLAHRDEVPEAFAKTIPLTAHQKAADYTLAKSKLGDIERGLGVALILILTLFGGINAAFEFCAARIESPLMAGVSAIALLTVLMSLFEIPVSWYGTFVIEEKFGFNKNTPAQFIKDEIMQLGLGAAIGLPILALILWIMDSVGSTWWIWAWAILISFSLLMSWLFPTVIAPLFNKFTPMADGALKTRISSLLERCGFHSEGIFIMDGSKRSGHGNAYFTGLGKNKRIVFYDNLVASLDDEELEGVLAHELGHFKCKHVIKMLIATSITMFIGFAILGWMIDKEWFFAGLGVHHASNAAALLLFTLIAPIFTFFMKPISAYFQRKFEFEADDFASQHAQASKLVSALVKLYEENASTLTPDPLFASFYYSHPPAAIRIAHLNSSASK
ncbi:MAG: M48 family metallopeptidase [Methylococcaceae bacterium]